MQFKDFLLFENKALFAGRLSDVQTALNNLKQDPDSINKKENARMIVAGIISKNSFEDVLARFVSINQTLSENGCKFQRPHLMPLFLPFLALPSVRILHSGVIDVKKRSVISPLA